MPQKQKIKSKLFKIHAPKNRFKIFLFCMAILFLGTLLLLLLAQIGTSHTITRTDQGFTPPEIKIKKGETVRFVNATKKPFWPASNIHPTHEIYPEFDPKQVLDSGQSWSFTFDRVGNWRYHDHLNPFFTGLVKVLDDRGREVAKKPFDVNSAAQSCIDVSLSKKQQCWDEALYSTIENQGLDAAFAMFSALYNTEPSIPKACHGWAHVLGSAAFDLYSQKKNFILRPEAAYCGYGFFHGFMEKLLQTTGDIVQAKNFCDYASDQLKDDKQRAYINCIHGIGHGSVDIEDPRKWGNFQAMIVPALTTCKRVLHKDEELRECYDGAFNAMSLLVADRQYKLRWDIKDVFSFCPSQLLEHQTSCYYEFAGSLSGMTGHNFVMAAKAIENIPSEEIAKIVIRKASADFMQDDIARPDWTQNVLDCRALPQYLYMMCYEGVVLGFISHGEPGKEYVKGLGFCSMGILTDDERQMCYEHILRYPVKAGTFVCASVDLRYRKYCHE